MNVTKTKIRTHVIQRPLGREFKYREKAQRFRHPNRGSFSALTDLIPLALKKKGEMTATELSSAIQDLWGVEYKRNSISEICAILCSKKIVIRESKKNGQGRPKIYWNITEEVRIN